MVVFPNCKINLGLNILHKRDDGFHNLETVFYPVPVTDVLEITRSSTHGQDVIFSQSGNGIDGDIADNLCVKAWHLLKKDFPALPPVQMHLHKAIPMGAGLGGGSADGAFVLQLLNKKFNLGIAETALIPYALQLGSDCPFFMVNKPCFATGRGEQLQPLKLSLSGYTLLLINPGIHINTGWAFKQLGGILTNRESKNLLRHIAEPVANWRNLVVNDFEAAVFPAYPAIQTIKEMLYDHGAGYAAMSGSGSSVFGLFKDAPPALSNLPTHYYVRSILL